MTADQSGAAQALADEIEHLMTLMPNSQTFTMKGTREELSVILAALQAPPAEKAEQSARFDRLLLAFHDAICRPLGVAPDSGREFYEHRLAGEAVERCAELAKRDGTDV